MNSKSLLPPFSISAYVSSILVIENSTKTDGFVVPLYANGSPTIIFLSAKAVSRRQSAGHFMLYGQTVAPDELSLDEPFTLIAYFLHPYSLNTLFGLNASELTNSNVDLNYLMPGGKFDLEEQLLNEQRLELRLALINDFLLNLSGSKSFDYSKIAFATKELKTNTGANALTDLQKELNMTERSLQRLFESQAGISPRMFKRVWQFHVAFQQLNQQQFSKLSDIAYEHGFSDQSHFVRVFKEFTGLTPGEYLDKAAPYNPKL
jgi:AraC-like DNA-binding protein